MPTASHFKVKGVNEVKKGRDQWGMQGRAQGQAQGQAPPTLFLDQTEGKRNGKILRLGPHLISGSGWRAPPPLSEGLGLPLGTNSR